MIRCLTQLADLNRVHRQFGAAKEAYEAIMSIYREVKVGICDELADAQAGYARLLLESANGQSESEQSAIERGGDLLESRTLFEYALRMYRKIHGDLHLSVGRVLMGLGEVHIELEEYEEALPFLDDALVVLTETCGATSLEMAECHNRVGSVLQALKVGIYLHKHHMCSYCLHPLNNLTTPNTILILSHHITSHHIPPPTYPLTHLLTLPPHTHPMT